MLSLGCLVGRPTTEINNTTIDALLAGIANNDYTPTATELCKNLPDNLDICLNEYNNEIRKQGGPTLNEVIKVIPKPVIIYVNGYWNGDLPYSSGDNLKNYWGSSFMISARNTNLVEKEYFINGANTFFSSGITRFNDGKLFAETRFTNQSSDFYKKIILSLQDNNGKYIKPLYFVSHSMGGAFAEGMISFLTSKGVPIAKIYHFSPADVSDFTATLPEQTIQIDIFPDPVLAYKNIDDIYYISNIKYFGIADNPQGITNLFGHAYTRGNPDESFIWDWVKNLLNSQMKLTTVSPNGIKYYSSSTATKFNFMILDGVKYKKSSLSNQYIKQ